MLEPRVYPLTPEAREAAKKLVTAWDEGKIGQELSVTELRSGGKVQATIIDGIEQPPAKSTLIELSEFNLVRWFEDGKFHLRQELRNAVNNDFRVSNYFNTSSDIETIVLALRELWGNNLLEEDQELFEALEELSEADEKSVGNKMGKLAEAMRRLLQDGNNAVGIIAGLRVILGFI